MYHTKSVYLYLLLIPTLVACGGGGDGSSGFTDSRNNTSASAVSSSQVMTDPDKQLPSSNASSRPSASSVTSQLQSASSKSSRPSSSAEVSSISSSQINETHASSSSKSALSNSSSSSSSSNKTSSISSSRVSSKSSNSSLSISSSKPSSSSLSISSSKPSSSSLSSSSNTSSSNLSSSSSNKSSSSLTSSSSSNSSTALITAGLLWPNGIEPGDPSICEAPNGKRCWWVDANAANGGNGNYSSPYNSFQLLEQNVRGGDFVYVRGTFNMAADSPSHKMSLNFYTTNASGTANDPTTLKSWRGSPRAVFSANRTDAQIRMTRTGGVRLQNIEITDFGDVGISVDETVNFAELINIVAHNGRVTQSSGIGGGVRFYAQDTLHTFIIRNSLFENTASSGETGSNVGALSIISEPSAQAGSTIKVYSNIFRNNHIAIRHKHAGQIHMEAYNNLIENNVFGFYLRTWSSDIHHNILVDNNMGMVLENQNANAHHDYTIRYNTFYNNDYFVQGLPDWNENTFHSAIHVQNNIFYASATGLGIFYIGATDWNWGRLDRSLATWTMNNNIFYYVTSTRNFLYSPPPTPEYTKNFTNGKAQFGDTSSMLTDPMFNDPTNKDFTLKSGSPAIGAGSNGTTPGALGGL